MRTRRTEVALRSKMTNRRARKQGLRVQTLGTWRGLHRTTREVPVLVAEITSLSTTPASIASCNFTTNSLHDLLLQRCMTCRFTAGWAATTHRSDASRCTTATHWKMGGLAFLELHQPRKGHYHSWLPTQQRSRAALLNQAPILGH